MNTTTLELRSLITPQGALQLSLEEAPLGPLAADEVLIRVEATPINPSDLGPLLGPADLDTLSSDRSSGHPVTTAQIPAQHAARVASRVGQSLRMGNEGAGVVVEAGENAKHLLGKVVSTMVRSMYTRLRKVRMQDVMVMPEGITPQQAASSWINPLTVLCMISTMRLEGHKALVHTAAASNVGQMLNKVCLNDGIELVNIVRNAEQVAMLKALGAKYIVDSSADDFRQQLIAALDATGATLAFDAVGGGPLAGQILAAMEMSLISKTPPTTPYGSPIHKQVYVYGRLDLQPTTVAANVGMAWGCGGWLVGYHLAKIGAEAALKMRERVANEITSTFATHYTREISLAEALDPEIIRAYQRKATGEKYLIAPSKD